MITFDARRRAELEERIARARACLAYAESSLALLRKQAPALRKLALVRGIGKVRSEKASKAAEFLEGTAAGSAEAARASAAEALEALLAMRSEFNSPIDERTA